MARLPEHRAGRGIQAQVLAESEGPHAAARLIPVLASLGAPLSGFLTVGNDHEGIVAAVERWLCNRRSDGLLAWNLAMTGSLAR